jgi:hypothetical protein
MIREILRAIREKKRVCLSYLRTYDGAVANSGRKAPPLATVPDTTHNLSNSNERDNMDQRESALMGFFYNIAFVIGIIMVMMYFLY